MQLNALCKLCKLFLNPQTLRCMKITAFILLAFCLHVSATTLAQNVTLSERKAPLEKVLNDIRQQTGYAFFYNQDWMQQAQPVDVQATNVSLEQVLKVCFANQPFDYAIVNRTIVLKLKEKLLEKKENMVSVTITAKVIDESNKPLLGVTVREKGTNNATATNEVGVFSITVNENSALITFSFVGFETQEIRAKDIPSGSTITLKAFSTNLKEVVVNKGYYNTTRELNTGNVSSVSANEIANQPVTNPLAALEGRVPGLFITQTNGLPGASFRVQLRGQNSIAQGNDPLYVIDGVPYTSTLQQNNNPAGGSPFDFINISDIDNINVLKDADATAIYGSRGANGVILITTKKGKAGKTEITINTSEGVGKVPHFMNLLNTPQYLQMRREAFKNDGVDPTVDNAPDLLVWDTTRYTNWQKALLGGSAKYSDIQGSISGGNTNTQFLISGGYHRQTTVFPGNNDDEKGTMSVSVSHSSDDQRFKASFVANYLSDNDNIPRADLTGQALNIPPDGPPPYNADGSLNFDHARWFNPYSLLVTKYIATNKNLIGNLALSYKILSNLKLSVSSGYNNLQTNEISTFPLAYFPVEYGYTSGNSSFTYNNIHSWIIEPQIDYNVTVWKGILNALIGGTLNQKTSAAQIINADGFSSDALLENIGSASSLTVGNSSNILYKYQAVYGRLNYNINDTYILNFVTRRDGSSRFGPANEFHNFASLGAAWIFSNEKFLKDNNFLSFGKIRASYGTTGNDQIGDYQFFSLFQNTSYPYGNSSGLYPKTLFNPNLQWEVNKKFEIGMDLGFFKNKISIGASYYRNRSSNQLVSYSLPTITGFSSITSNLPAVVQNTGFELVLNSNNITSKSFKWTTSLSLSVPNNKLISYPNLSTSPYRYFYLVGEPITGTKIFHYVGVDPQTGLYQFASGNGGVTTSPDITTDGTKFVNTSPKYYGGLNNNFSYKNFELDFSIYFVKQVGTNYAYGGFGDIPPGFYPFNQPAGIIGNEWQKPGDHKIFQPFTQQNYDLSSGISYIQQSDGGYVNSSFIRLRNASLSYQFAPSALQKFNLKRLKVFIRGENLFTLTHHYIGLDPETGSIGNLPNLRVLSAGLNITL